jgi:hypothetical protein
MSAYLSHIAELSLGHLTPVEPRLASRYEPVSTNASLDSFNEFNDQQPPRSVTETAPSIQNEHDKPQHVHIAEPKVQQPTMGLAEKLTDPKSDNLRPKITQPINQISNIYPIVEKTNTQVERVQERFFSETVNNATVLSKHVVDSARSTAHQNAKRINNEVISMPTRAETKFVKPDAQSTNKAQSNLQFRSESLLAAPTPEPIINVTIGRIEIRATTETNKTTAKTQSAPKTMSLDEYLNRRNGSKS